ncbi:hypothetical protein HYT23_03275 [Candidatus Pacearchaeota archaeon]|nr:hypothetical protein [Candidatus Pacearchaeota archaeon]
MDKRNILKYAIIDAFGTAVYVIVIAYFVNFLSNGMFGNNKTVLIPIAMLMLFVFSAALTGTLVFGRPISWYFDNKKHEAFLLIFSTLAIFALLMILVFLLLILG